MSTTDRREAGKPHFDGQISGFHSGTVLGIVVSANEIALMIRNYFTIALRTMMRNRAYTFINVAGLSLGVACCLLLALYIQDEASFDKHHPHLENLYQVTSIMGDDGKHVMRTTSPPIVWGIKDELPEIDQVTRLVNPPGVSQSLVRYEDKQFYETDGVLADSTIFDIFHYEFEEGNPKKALAEANSIVISESMAQKLFGSASALDKHITVNQGGPEAEFKVTGVLAAEQANTHIRANFFISMTSTGWAEYMRTPQVTNQWAGQNFAFSYLRLKPGHTPEDFIPKMNKVFLKYGAENLKTLGMKKELGLQPVKDIYLYATYGDNTPRVTYLYVVGSIALFILLIACVNFTNLSTAKATKRAGEVGLRKTLGAQRSTLIKQFLGEALVIVVAAIAMSILIVQALVPFFNDITMKSIRFDVDNFGFIAVALAIITLSTGIVAGSYPAFYLSSFQPARVLKGKLAVSSSGSLLRKSLVVFQFVIGITLVCGMIMVSRQLNFMQTKDLGFDAGNKLVLPLRSESVRNNYQVLKNELSKVASVRSVSAANYIPGGNIWHDFSVYPEGSSMEKAVMVKNVRIEPDYMDVLRIGLVAGRAFTENREAEIQNKIILNETAVKRLGLQPEGIIGQQLYSDRSTGRASYEVIGVMKDYHQVSVRDEIFPVMFLMNPQPSSLHYMVMDIENRDVDETIASIASAWNKLNAGTPFEYTFLDENIRQQYEEDKRVSKVITSFTVIALVISCLGLYGLSTYMAERRFKEIGIRKVMGASIGQIARMMSGEFARLVLIAFAIAVPLSWYAIDVWLQNFAYKSTVGAGMFAAAGAGALLIALLTVSFESIRAATGNPVDALRNE